MEKIVTGIAQMNFQQNLTGATNQNNAPSSCNEYSTKTAVCNSPVLEEQAILCEQSIDNRISKSVNEIETFGESSCKGSYDNLERDQRNKVGYTLKERREMPNRVSKESSRLGIKRRTIMKPIKRINNSEDFSNIKPADIKKIYLNKKLTNFKPSCLETIFEETSTIHNEKDCNPLIGGRKLKRLLSFSDGFRYSKTLIKKRRAKIKKSFAKRSALKKISLEDFITKLNTNVEKNQDVPSNENQIQDYPNKIVNDFSYTESFESNISATLNHDAMINIKLPSNGLSYEFANNTSLVDKY